MKFRQSLLLLIFLLSTSFVGGQIPDGFNYQAVARNTDGTVMTNSNVEVIFEIRVGNETGSVLWKETYDLTTNAIGSFSVVVGGDPAKRTGGSEANFADIDWSADQHFLEVTLDSESMGVAQLVSVPYAIHAGSVDMPMKNLEVIESASSLPDEALFEVKRVDGSTVFGVYNEGVRVFVDDNSKKGVKGGFAVGGYNASTKGYTNEYLRVTPDSVRVWVNEAATKGIKGGFAVGGYNSASKTTPTSFMELDPENYFIGHEAGLSNDTGVFNSFFGYQAGRGNIGGNQNIFVGYNSGYTNTTGSLNTFIGNRTGYANTTGFANVFIGDSSGYYNETGQWNVFVGEGTGIRNSTGLANVFIGDKAGRKNTTGNVNVFLGSIAGWNNIDGWANVFIGSGSGKNNTNGSNNNFLGKSAGGKNTTGSNNIFIGTGAGGNNTIGEDNIYIGRSVGYNSQETNSNIFIGNNSGEQNVVGEGNVFLGNRAGTKNSDGHNNTYLGHESAHNKTSGVNNTIIGAYSGFDNTTGENNVYVGAHAAHYSTLGFENVVIGRGAGAEMDGSSNIFIGNTAGALQKGDNQLIIENSEADSLNALIYGNFWDDLLTINGKLGINTTDPWYNLHVSSKGTYAKLLVGQRDSIPGYGEFAGSGSGPGGGSIRLGLSADMDDANEYWQVGVYNEEFQIGTNNEFRYFVITKDGEIWHRGVTQIHADFVFDENYSLESIEDHADYMWQNSHLPAVPKAKVDEDGMEVVNLGARNKGVLEELEKAHIYIEQLNDALKDQQAMILELKQEVEMLKSEK